MISKKATAFRYYFFNTLKCCNCQQQNIGMTLIFGTHLRLLKPPYIFFISDNDIGKNVELNFKNAFELVNLWNSTENILPIFYPPSTKDRGEYFVISKSEYSSTIVKVFCALSC